MAEAGAGEFWAALNEANKSRARLYVAFFRAIEGRFGRAAAIDICKESIRGWGRGLAAGLEARRPNDFAGLIESFARAPDGGAMFRPRVDRCDESGLDVQFEACPLKTAWLESGMPEEEVEMFCAIAAEADYGTLEAAGFTVEIETWRRGRAGCCALRIRPR
jgi:hypothetical protein